MSAPIVRRSMTGPGQTGSGSSRGYAMIESLVAILLIALWMLAIAGAEATTSKYQRSAGYRFAAVSLAAELGERMNANADGANAGNYALASTASAVTASADCSQANCKPSDLARYDLAQWTARAVSTLPLKDVTVTQGGGAGAPIDYTIRIRWDEPRGRQTYSSEGTSETLSHTLVKVIPRAGT